MSFETALQEVLGIETDQYTDQTSRPADRGGPTKYGIIQTTYDRARTRWGEPERSVRYITMAEVVRIYREDFWEAGHCNELSEPLATVHFDGCVQHGPEQAAKLLQAVLGVKQDGKIGPKTLAAAWQKDPGAAAEELLWERAHFYALIVRNEALHDGEATQADNILGWINRIRGIRAAVLT